MKEISVFHDDGPIDLFIIFSFEQQLGYQFPQSYKTLLSQHNGLDPEECDFDFIFEGQKDTRDVSFKGYGTEISSASQISRAQQTEYCHAHIVVIGVAANGDYICFDYRADPTTDNPPVVVMFHDDYDENDKMIICPVADSFDAFIDCLYAWEDEDD